MKKEKQEILFRLQEILSISAEVDEKRERDLLSILQLFVEHEIEPDQEERQNIRNTIIEILENKSIAEL